MLEKAPLAMKKATFASNVEEINAAVEACARATERHTPTWWRWASAPPDLVASTRGVGKIFLATAFEPVSNQPVYNLHLGQASTISIPLPKHAQWTTSTLGNRSLRLEPS